MHVPKTAGSSLIENFENEYAERIYFISHAVQRKLGAQWGNYDKYQRENIAKEDFLSQHNHHEKVVFGHQTFGWHRVIDGESTYVSFVREPKKRLQSLYKYIIMLEDHYLSDLIKNKPIKEFLEETEYLDFDNGMVRQFSGIGKEKPFGMIDDNDYALAIQNIDKHFSFIGIQEEFEKSLLLMSKVLGWEKRPYIVTVNSSEEISNSLDAGDIAYIERLNKYDLMLYDYIHTIFTRNLNDLSEREVSLFVRRNKKYGKLLRFKSKVMKRLRSKF